MGVDYYNCSICGNIYADCEDYDTCEGCGISWCRWCMEDIQKFKFDGENYCDNCFFTTARHPTDAELLDFALKQLAKSKQQLTKEIQRTRPFLDEIKTYYCTQCDSGKCNSECDILTENNDDDERGFCCVAKHGIDPDEFCSSCQQWYDEALYNAVKSTNLHKEVVELIVDKVYESPVKKQKT